MARKLTDEFLKWTLDVDGKPAMAALNSMEQSTRSLQNTNKALFNEMAKLEAQGKKSTAEYAALNQQYVTNNATIRQATTRMAELRAEIGINGLTALQLRQRMAELKRALDQTVPNSPAWRQQNQELQAVASRYRQVTAAANGTNSVFGEIKGMLPAMGFAAVVAGLGAMITRAVTVRSEFSKYEAVLTNTLGSQSAANEAFAMLKDFAATTPFQLNELTGSYVKLVNQGFKPTREQLTSLGDLAASQGKSFDQLTEAILDAQTGENERLKEFGIKAKVTGDKVAYTFKGVTTEVANNSEAIRKYILSLGDIQGVVGGMAAISKTVGGALSNASDATDSFFNAIGEKLEPVIVSLVNVYGDLLNSIVKYGSIILSVIGTITAYVAAVKIAALWDNIEYGYLVAKAAITKAYRFTVDVLTGRITLATLAQQAWNLAQKMNPIGLVIGILVAAGSALYLYTRRMSEAQIATKTLADVNLQAKQKIIDEKVAVEQLLRVAQNEKLSKDARLEALKKLIAISPEYFGSLSLETINTQAATTATNLYVESLLKKAKVEAANEKLKAIASERMDIEGGKGQEAGFFESAFTMLTSTGSGKGLDYQGAKEKRTASNRANRLAELTTEETAITSFLDNAAAKDGPAKPKPLTDKEIKAAEKIAMEALDLAHKQRVLILTQQYENEERLQKEFHSRMLAEEIAFIQAQLGIEKDPAKKVDLQTQLITKLKDYHASVKEATPEIMKNSAERKNLTTVMFEEAKLTGLAADAMGKSATMSSELTSKLQNQGEVIQGTINVVSDGLFNMMSGQQDAFQTFAQNMIMFALDVLKQQTEIAIAGATIQSLTQPDSIATFGASGFARAAVLVGLIESAFAIAKGAVSKAFGGGKQSKGKQSGGYADGDVSDSTPVGVYHANEFIASAPIVRNPTVKPILDIIDIAQRTGNAKNLNLAKIISGGRQTGGYASVPAQIQVPAATNPKLDAVIERLTAILEKGVPAYINKYGHYGIQESLEQITKFNNITK